jgi:hypothetical protein
MLQQCEASTARFGEKPANVQEFATEDAPEQALAPKSCTFAGFAPARCFPRRKPALS